MSAVPPARRVPDAEASGGRLRAGAPVLLPALTVLGTAVVTSFTAVVATSGGAAPLLLARVGARLALDLSWSAVLGILALLLLVLPADDGRRGRLLDVAAVAAGVAAIAAGLTAFLLYLGRAPAMSAPAFGPGLVAFLSEAVIGRTWLVAAILAAVLSAALVAVRSSSGLVLLALVAVASLVPVALQSATPDGTLAGARTTGAAAFVLLLAAGTWIGVVPAPLGQRRGTGAVRMLTTICPVLAIAAVLLGALPPLPLGLPLAAVLLVALLVARLSARPLPSSVLPGVAGGLVVAARVLQSAQSAPSTAAGRTSPAEILSGAPLPPVPSAGSLLLGWQPDAVWLLLSGGLLVGYLGAVRRLRRSGDRWPAIRVVSWVGGVLLLVWTTSGGPAVYAAVLLSASLGRYAALVAAVPLLLAGGAPLRLLAATRPFRARAQSRLGALARPVPAAVLAVGAFVALFATPLLRWSVTGAVGAEEAVLQCLLTGALLVSALLRAPRRTAIAVTAVLLLAETAAAAFLGVGRGLLLADWYGAMGWGTDALVDQRLGAVLAWAITVVATLVLLVAALRRPAVAPAVVGPDRPRSPADRSEVPA